MTPKSRNKQDNDAVANIIEQWQQQGFESDKLIAMEVIGRIKRLETVIMRRLSANYKQNFQLSHWEFDVLATLRRSGTPYCLSPTSLFASMMVSSGTMSNRLQHLEKKQLIKRVESTHDKRSLLVQLTDKGLSLINSAIESHINLENELVAGLSDEELVVLNMLLKKVGKQLDKG